MQELPAGVNSGGEGRLTLPNLLRLQRAARGVESALVMFKLFQQISRAPVCLGQKFSLFIRHKKRFGHIPPEM